MKFLLKLTLIIWGILIYIYWNLFSIYIYEFLKLVLYFLIITIGLIAVLYIRDRIAYYRLKNDM